MRKIVPFIAAAPLALALAAIVAAAGWSAMVALVIGTLAVALLIAVSVPYAFRVSEARRSPLAPINGSNGRTVAIEEGGLVVELSEEIAERAGVYSGSNATDARLIAPMSG